MLARGDQVITVVSVAQQSTSSSSPRGGSTALTSSHFIASSTNTRLVQTSTQTASINTSPFFPEPSTLNPPSSSVPSSQDLARTVLGILIVILVVISVFSLAFKRYLYLKRTNQPLSRFIPWPRRRPRPTTNGHNSSNSSLPSVHARTRIQLQSPANARNRSRSRHADDTAYVLPFTPSLSSRNMTALMDDDVRYPITAASLAVPHNTLTAYTHPYPRLHSYPPHIALQMLHNRNNRPRTRALDVDAQGRRLDSGWDPDQFDFEVGAGQGQGGCDQEDKEMLPAYDCYGGPPKYIDVEIEVDDVERARSNSSAEFIGNDTGNRNSHQERPSSSSAVVGHQGAVDPVQENGG